MKMTYTKSAFEMPDGKYLAKFVGTTLREDKPGEKPRLGQDGNPLPPAMTWDFEIVEGPEAGKKADKLTGRVPTPKSGCGKMLAAISDTILKDGQEIDLNQFVGCLYRITIVENRVSDNPAPVRVYEKAPEPGQQRVPSASDPEARWDVSDGTNVLTGQTSAEVQNLIDGGKHEASRFRVKPAGASKEAAKTADQWGFRDGAVIPF